MARVARPLKQRGKTLRGHKKLFCGGSAVGSTPTDVGGGNRARGNNSGAWFDSKPFTPTCPNCGDAANRVSGDVIYPHRPDLRAKLFYHCAPCDAYVGCHADGRPFGTLADKQTREARQAAHATFDPIWKRGFMKRKEAYAWLAEHLGVKRCHIGESDAATCWRIVEICEAFK